MIEERGTNRCCTSPGVRGGGGNKTTSKKAWASSNIYSLYDSPRQLLFWSWEKVVCIPCWPFSPIWKRNRHVYLRFVTIIITMSLWTFFFWGLTEVLTVKRVLLPNSNKSPHQFPPWNIRCISKLANTLLGIMCLYFAVQIRRIFFSSEEAQGDCPAWIESHEKWYGWITFWTAKGFVISL